MFYKDYSKLPASPPVDLIFLLDPLIATGGTATAAMHMITDWGIPRTYTHALLGSCIKVRKHIPVNKVKLLCILASEEGLKNLSGQFPGLEVGYHIHAHTRSAFSYFGVDMGRCC